MLVVDIGWFVSAYVSVFWLRLNLVDHSDYFWTGRV